MKMRLQGFSKFLAPILLAVLTLAIADDGSHDPNLYQFLDFTRVVPVQKNENRPFKWLGKLRRSKNQKPVHSEPASYQPENQYDSTKPINYDDDHSSPSYNPSLQQPAFKIAPFRLKKLGKKSKESAQIILPPLPSINQASSNGLYNPGNYGSKEDSFTFQPGTPYRQTQPVPTSPATTKQQQQEEPTYSALELAFNAPKPSSKQRSPVQQSEVSYSPQQTSSNNSPPNSPVTSNAGSEYDADSVSPPSHSDSRYSKWFSKLRRRKSNHNQPEKPQYEPLKVHDKPSENAPGIPESIYYYQNSSPFNPSQQGATQNQPGNGQSVPYSRNPQIANGSPQVAPARPVNTKHHPAAPPAQSEILNSPVQPPINYDSHSETEEAPQHPPPSGNFYSKFMKKIKRNKTQKPEPITVVSQPEPIYNPVLQTAYNNPQSDPSVYRHPQTSPQSTPTSRPANIIKPQPTASPAPYSPHHQGFNQPATAHPEAPSPYSALGNSPARPQHVAPVQKPTHSLNHESDAFFPPPNRPDFPATPFQKQSEKGQGNNGDPEGFFEFGIFPTANGFFDQNFKG